MAPVSCPVSYLKLGISISLILKRDIHAAVSMCAESEIQEKIHQILGNKGFETYPFKIGWYNEQVQQPFKFDLPPDTLAFVIISTPSMFQKAFIPYVKSNCCSSDRDPLDKCLIHYFNLVKKEFPDLDVEGIHDFELTHSRRPKVLVQTAGHVAGGAHYYQRSDVVNEQWGPKKKICGVSLHPKYGGWFALRGVLIFKEIQAPNLVRKLPEDILPDNDGRIRLLELFNFHWQDWRFRDVVPVEEKYSEEQKLYFATLPKDRSSILDKLTSTESIDIPSNIKDAGHA